MVVEHAPATLHFGNISSFTDVFMCRADDADDQLLIQHTVPVTGGMSGSPLGGWKRQGGRHRQRRQYRQLRHRGHRTQGWGSGRQHRRPRTRTNVEIDEIRIPSAAMVNFAQRIDLLEGSHERRGRSRRPAELLGQSCRKRFVKHVRERAKARTSKGIRRAEPTGKREVRTGHARSLARWAFRRHTTRKSYSVCVRARSRLWLHRQEQKRHCRSR